METLLKVENLKKYFSVQGGWLHAVDDVSFKINRGKTLGIVGESGCGKSTLGRTILHLLDPTSGEIWFEGKNISTMDNQTFKKTRLDMQIIFQDPFSSLNPKRTVEDIIGEPLQIFNKSRSKNERTKLVADMMETVGLASRLAGSYPHELDGGRRQRVGVARALVLKPKLIVCDEPVSALDVSIQAQILNLLQDLQKEFNLTYMFITHDLSVVRHISDDICVMYLGTIVEKCASKELFKNPQHPYTKALLSAIPIPELNSNSDRIILKGEISSPINIGNRCRFIKRCDYAMDICNKESPKLMEIDPGHEVACWLYNKKA